MESAMSIQNKGGQNAAFLITTWARAVDMSLHDNNKAIQSDKNNLIKTTTILCL